MIIQLSKELYDSLSESERSVVAYLNRNEDKIPLLSITTIAENTLTSPATVSRTIQKCGFQGIAALRYKISENNHLQESKDSPYTVNAILEKTYRECTKTIDGLCVADILQAIEYIKKANRIYIYARGFTTLIAEEFQMYLQLLGYDAVITKDVMWMKNTDKIVTPDDTVLILSIRDSTPELSVSARMAQRIGAKVVSCCCKENSRLEKYSDIVINGHSELIMQTKGQTVYSRIPLLIITRTITEYLSL